MLILHKKVTRLFSHRFHCANYFIERWLKPMQTRKMDERKIEGALKGSFVVTRIKSLSLLFSSF